MKSSEKLWGKGSARLPMRAQPAAPSSAARGVRAVNAVRSVDGFGGLVDSRVRNVGPSEGAEPVSAFDGGLANPGKVWNSYTPTACRIGTACLDGSTS